MGGESVWQCFKGVYTKCEKSTSFNNTFLRAQAALTKILLNNNKKYKLITINTEHFLNIGGGSMIGWMAPLFQFKLYFLPGLWLRPCLPAS